MTLQRKHHRALHKRAIALVAILSPILGAASTSAHAGHNGNPAGSDCAAIAHLSLSETIAISTELVESGTAAGQSNLPVFCRVALTVAQQINIEVWLPTDSYNRRFQAVGGGGYAGSISYFAMAAALRSGYATASTDTGHTGGSGAFALNPDGTLNDALIEDFASRSLIQMTEKAQSLIAAFYGSSPKFNYWNGCSTGGRQGLMLAQRLPDAYDGMLTAAPAINWDRFIPAELWPQVVMQNELGGPMGSCKLDAFTAAAVAHCDGYDGVLDGMLGDPRNCDFDPTSLVGQDTGCGPITETDARVVEAIWNGPTASDGTQLWYGLEPGASLTALAGNTPFPIAEIHHRLWVEHDPTWDWHELDYAGFEENFRSSQTLFNEVIGTDDPDLRAFRRNGGKLLLWHGWSDQLIFPEGTIDYYERVVDVFHSRTRVERFARLFMAPGVAHCGGGPGPNQFDMFGALVDWVERNHAPSKIEARLVQDGQVVRTMPLCLYPRVAVYDRSGDPNEAKNYRCKPKYGRSAGRGHH